MQRIGYREIEEMSKGAGHHVLWEGKYITQGCAASACAILAGEEPWHLPDVICFLCPSLPYLACCCASRTPRRKTARVAGVVPTVLTMQQIIRTQRTFPPPAARPSSNSARKTSRKMSRNF